MVEQLRSGEGMQKEEAMKRLAQGEYNKVIVRARGIAALVALARDGTDGQKEEAARTLAILACNSGENTIMAAHWSNY